MPWEMLKRKILGKTEARPCMVVSGGKLERVENPLPRMFPTLYNDKPDDKYGMIEEMLQDADSVVRELMSSCWIRQPKLPYIIGENLRSLLEIPVVYSTQKFLKAKKMSRFYNSNIALTALMQMACFYGRSEMVERLRQNLMPALLGAFFRYYGIGFIRQAERDEILKERKFDVNDDKQLAMRRNFLDNYRRISDQISRQSSDKFSQLIGDKHKCPDDILRMTLDIIRYSTRLMGRAAEVLKPQVLDHMHPLCGYVAVLHNFGSAWFVSGKRTGLILAEEWSRAQVSHRHKDIHHTAQYNLHALQDIFRICRCKVIPNFQDSGRDAVFAEVDNMIFRRKSLLTDSQRRRRATGEGSSKVSSRWECCRPKVKIDVSALDLKDAVAGRKKMGGEDPGDDQLRVIE